MYKVYRYVRLDSNTTFYVGKGKRDRPKNLTRRNPYFKNIIKTAPFKLEILFENMTQEEALAKEAELIQMYKSQGQCEANLSLGGDQGPVGVKRSAETRAKISAAKMGHKAEYLPSFSGRKHSPETRARMSATRRANLSKVKEV